MFADTEQSNFGALLQGDIVANVPLLGAIDASSVVGIPATSAWAAGGKLELGFAAVLSHSCEISTANGIKVTSCILAPLRDVSSATPPDKLQLLIDSNDVKAEQPTFLKYFYQPSHPQIGHHKGSVVDFSKLFSVRKTNLEFLLSKKILQVTDVGREQLSRKLALYFFRS
jgi:hypothetical protein